MNRRSLIGFGFVAVALATPALATLPSGVTGVVQARGTVGELVDVQEAANSDFVMQQITIQPGGSTGWHTHPGAALVTIKSGALTVTGVRDERLGSAGDGTSCITQTYSAGQAFVDPGHGRVHIGRNLGTGPVEIWVTYTGVKSSAAGAFRLDAADPGC